MLRYGSKSWSCIWAVVVWCTAGLQLAAREKDTTDYGVGFITNITAAEDEVTQVVSDVVQNGIIRGTKEYNKDPYISGAEAAVSTNLLPTWTEGGKVFYKIRKQVLDPRNFKESNDVGTIAVRYVIQPQGENNTVLRIDAVFVEDFRHTVHPSDGTVESSEYQVIHDRIEAMELMKKEAAEAEQERQRRLARKNLGMGSEAPETNASKASLTPAEPYAINDGHESLAAGPALGETLEEHIANLRRELQRLVKAPGAPLKSAPFHSASTLKTLPTGAEVLIVIRTTYWFGVETRDGQHGWIPREELESLP